MTLTSDEAKALRHLGYEWWMFRTMQRLAAGLDRDDDPVRNALVESLVIHGRTLIDFFYTPPKKGDDLVATHVRCSQRADLKAELKAWKTEADKRVAHLTAARFIDYDTWNVDEVRRELETCIDEVKTAMRADLPHDWIGDRPETSKYLPCGPSSPPGGYPTGGGIGATGAKV